MTVDPDGSVTERLTVTPSIQGDDVRLTILLYADSVPENPSRDTAYRSVHVWMDVHATTDC